jgi:hypothetical protein
VVGPGKGVFTCHISFSLTTHPDKFAVHAKESTRSALDLQTLNVNEKNSIYFLGYLFFLENFAEDFENLTFYI